MARRLLTGNALLKRAHELGINTDGEGFTNYPGRGTLPNPAPEQEVQQRVMDAERHLREHRLWWVALISAIASAISALTALVALYVTR